MEYMAELSMNYFNFQYAEKHTCCAVFIKEISVADMSPCCIEI